MIRSLFVAVALLAAACTAPAPGDQAVQPAGAATFVGVEGRPLVSAEGVIDGSVQDALTADAAACAKAGGEVRPVCRMQKPMCVVTFPDANKACSDGSECGSGRCVSANPTASSGKPARGQCRPTNDPCGCYQTIEDGVAQPMLCAD